jgi:hypothetical protein
VIVILGRPGLTTDGRLARAAGRIAIAAAQAGGRVELVGSVGDDADGQKVALALGVAGIGHAALLRDPAGVTPRIDADGGETGSPLARLDRADVDLGLRYLPFCRVLVAAEPLQPGALDAALDAATYHGAALIALIPTGAAAPAPLPEDATVLELPAQDDGAFADLVGRYAARLAAGEPAADAWRGAVEQTGWEPAAQVSAEPSPTGR